MKLAIMFYNIPEIDIRTIPNSIDNIDAYIEDEFGCNIEDVSWQTYDEDVKINIC